jgi:hypothetical protein
VLRILAWQLESEKLLFVYTDVLVIATMACFVRFMNVFAVSKSLVYLVLIYIFVFVLVCFGLFWFVLVCFGLVGFLSFVLSFI